MGIILITGWTIVCFGFIYLGGMLVGMTFDEHPNLSTEEIIKRHLPQFILQAIIIILIIISWVILWTIF